MLAWTQACSRPRRLILISAGVLSFPWVGSVASADLLPLASVDDLRGLSREPLANVQVTSVSKTAEPLSDAVAAVYVISHDDIVRSGAASAPEVLRLAPNLQVSAITASSYAITARGLNVNAAYKLLLLVDCRSVYTPLFGGVLWDEIAVRLEDIGRIEVIGGPCAMVWGANAGNGVINIVTPKSNDTPGGLLELDAGTRATTATL
jgi:iron complex outermembrane receptor protein